MTIDMFLSPLPVVDCNDDDNDYSDDLFDPLPLNDQQNESSDFLLLNDLVMMDFTSFSPKKNTIINSNHNMMMMMKRPRRRVSFQEQPTEISVPSFACLGETERRGLWYMPSEIERFRSVVRYACRTLRKNPNAFPETRGLELRTSQNRQMRKHLALSCIIKAQVRYPNIDPLHLATIATRCTALPREEALVQGTRDYCDAYYSSSSAFFPTGTSSIAPAISTSVAPVVPIEQLNQAATFQNFPLITKKRVVPALVDLNLMNQQEDGPLLKRRRFVAPSEENYQFPLLTIAY